MDVSCPHASCTYNSERHKLAEHIRECPAAVKAAQAAKWHSAAELCARLNPPAADVVRLNVGGRTFMCSRRTLCKYPLSLLGMLCSENNRQLERLEDGSVFIDRNGDVFGVLLEWLRDCSSVALDRLSGEMRKQLRTEAAFWQLEELLAACTGRAHIRMPCRYGCRVTDMLCRNDRDIVFCARQCRHIDSEGASDAGGLRHHNACHSAVYGSDGEIQGGEIAKNQKGSCQYRNGESCNYPVCVISVKKDAQERTMYDMVHYVTRQTQTPPHRITVRHK